jgi:sec-independent protein translocase protein TatA
MGSIGVWQVLLVLVIVLIIFGAGKLPRVMGDFGKGIRSFKSGIKEEEEAEGEAKEGETVQRQIDEDKKEPVNKADKAKTAGSQSTDEAARS